MSAPKLLHVAAYDKRRDAWLRPRHLLSAAAIFHIVVTLGICGLGYFGFFPSIVDPNGTVVAFAPDGTKLRLEALQLSDQLAHGQIRDWVNASSSYHIKIYSLCFALLRPLFGSSVLSAEPVNVFYYLAILAFVFYLGREIFNSRAGLIATAVVAIWPTFLLHTTQLLKDPLFVAGMLGFVAANVRLLSRRLSWRNSVLTATVGGLSAAVAWLSRDSMGAVVIATAILAGILFLIQELARQRSRAKSSSETSGWRVCLPMITGMTLLIILSVAVTRVIPEFHRPSSPDPAVVASGGQNSIWRDSRRRRREQLFDLQTPDSVNSQSRLVRRIGRLRQGFLFEFPDAGSNIDSDVQIHSTADLVRYLPRAAMIGFFVPFPKMWFATGNQVSRRGRLLSGFETLAMYLVEALAIVALWRGRRRASIWFLWLVAAMGMLALGLVVINAGALYRLRYVFVILLIVLAAEGAALTLERIARKVLIWQRSA